MKKLILSAAIILGGFSAFAQQSAPPKSEVTTQQTTTTTQTVKDAFTEIKLEEVPEPVKSALIKAYPTAVLNKAFINEKKEYELQVKVGDREGSLYADATGAWIKK
jgi:hypothetical protein